MKSSISLTMKILAAEIGGVLFALGDYFSPWGDYVPDFAFERFLISSQYWAVVLFILSKLSERNKSEKADLR